MTKNSSERRSEPGPDAESDILSFIAQRSPLSWFLCVGLFAVLIRLATAIHPYSGEGTPPMYGDYEAQRHWMEVAVNVPVRDWYRNSSINDLRYWGLDYPPLTGYQSYAHGLLLRYFDPKSVDLLSSHGYESYIGKLLMRWTVLMSDVMIFFPSVLYFVTAYYRGGPKSGSKIAWHAAMILLNPCLVLIDHGHFQYNCISLGLTVAAVAAIISNRDLVGSILFALALNHKQMSAYYAPAFFGYLLGKSLRHQNPILQVTKLGLVVLGTLAVIWWPYLHSLDASLEVLSRLAPFERGIYEDYVANFWCATSMLIKWKRLFPTQSLKLISLSATVSTFLPSMAQLIWSPTKKGFLYGLLNCSLSFYMFSFQVHEKSILLPLIPASLLAAEEPFIFKWLIYTAMLSMFPLLRRDKLVLPYMALYSLFILLHYTPRGARGTKENGSWFSILKSLGLACSVLLHLVYLMMTPPQRYPYLFEALIVIFCFSQFVSISMYLNRKQWALTKGGTRLGVKKNL